VLKHEKMQETTMCKIHHLYACVCVYVSVCVCMRVRVYIYVCAHTCAYICMYAYIIRIYASRTKCLKTQDF